MQGLGELQTAIDEGQTSSFLEKLPRGINANLCEAILGMKPDTSEVTWEVSISWSPAWPVDLASLPRSVRFQDRSFGNRSMRSVEPCELETSHVRAYSRGRSFGCRAETRFTGGLVPCPFSWPWKRPTLRPTSRSCSIRNSIARPAKLTCKAIGLPSEVSSIASVESGICWTCRIFRDCSNGTGFDCSRGSGPRKRSSFLRSRVRVSPFLTRGLIASLLATAGFEVPEFLFDPREMLRRGKPQNLHDVTLIDPRQPVAFRHVGLVQASPGMTRPLPRERYVVGRAGVLELSRDADHAERRPPA